jgi:16S rRNA (guanine527-N7)-methyltransferase
MVNENQIDTFTRFYSVSRETIKIFKKYEEMLIRENKSLNLIGDSTINTIWERHFMDSCQIIDFIDKNDKNLVDIGSGAGFPGLALAIIARDRNIPVKVKLIDKSPKKTNFLSKISKELSLDIEVVNVNIFQEIDKIRGDIIVARAFKPLKIILELIHNIDENWKKTFVFLGKSGQEELHEASKIWDLKYKQRVSVTNDDSIVIELNKLKRK